MTFNPVAWLVWLLAAALPALLTRNPMYLVLALLATWVTHVALGRHSPAAQSWDSFVRFGAALWLLTIPFTVLTVHYGAIVIFNLPANWPIIGGPITLEALLFAVTGGLALLTLLLAFATFNTAVDQARLLRLTPGFLYQAGIIAAIAVAFVPQMVASWQTIREAQEVRGHKVRGVRDLLPLIMPLLVTALERAMHLAESMEARGFGREMQPVRPARRFFQQLAVLGGLCLFGVGLAGTGFWPNRGLLCGLLLAGGAILLVASFWDQGRRVQRSHYRRWYWTPVDRAVCAIGAVGVAGWLAVWLLHGTDWLLYYPYPPYSPWPTFEPIVGLLALTPALAGLVLPRPARVVPSGAPAPADHGRGPGVAGGVVHVSRNRAAHREALGERAPGAAGERLLRPRMPADGLAVPAPTTVFVPARPRPGPFTGVMGHLRRLGIAVLLTFMWRR
jgi:energy-coupling factor transport system permease protein